IAVKTPEYPGRTKIGDLLAQSQNLFYLDSLNENKIALIRSKVPDTIVFKLSSSKKEREQSSVVDAFQLFRKFGVKFGEEFIRENNLKTKRKERIVPEDLPVHEAGAGWYSWGRFRTVRRHTSRTAREDIGSDTIRVPEGSMRKYLRLLSLVKTRYKIVKDCKDLDNSSSGTDLASFVDGVGRKIVQTSDGKKRVADTIRHSNKSERKKKVKLVLYSDPSITKDMHSEGHLSIAGDDDLLFELMAFYEFHGIEYTLDLDGSEALALVVGHNYRRGEFIADPGYPKIGDSEILYSVVHAAKTIKDEKMLSIFLNAIRYSKEATEVKEMREYLISKELNRR
ncbi:MAG: hypothetical protein HRF40_12290, partial [Nitrososphaera sp.]